MPALPIIVCHVTALVTARHLNQIRVILTPEVECSAIPAIQQTAGEIRVHSIIAPTPMLITTGAAIIQAIIELAKQRALTVIKTIVRHLFRIPIKISTSPSARAATQVISKVKGITMAERTVLLNKTRIAVNRDAIVSTVMVFDFVEVVPIHIPRQPIRVPARLVM